jgi:hypothetical protein
MPPIKEKCSNEPPDEALRERMCHADTWKTERWNRRIQSLAVARVIPSCTKFTSNARQYQPFALGRSRPGNILSRTRNMMVARTTNMLGRVIDPLDQRKISQ